MKLSAWKYIKNNKKTAGVMIIALAFSFMAMYLIYMLLVTAVECEKPVKLEFPKKVTMFKLSDQTMGVMREDYEDTKEYDEAVERRREELLEAFKATPGIKDAFYEQTTICPYTPVVAQAQTRGPLMDAERIPSYMEHIGATLTDGRLPKEDGEILVDEVLMKNQKMQVGDWFVEDWYGESFKIVGTIQSDYMAVVGTPKNNNNTGLYFFLLTDEPMKDIRAVLEEKGIRLTNEDRIIDVESGLEDYKENENVIGTSVSTICIVIMVFLPIALIANYLSIMRDRVSEYCLYASIGFSKSEIYGMMMREALILFGMGIVLGLSLSFGVGSIVKSIVIDSRGLGGRLICPEQIYKILADFVIVIGILQIPMVTGIMKIRTIDAIEE